MPPRVEMAEITRCFGRVVANDRVDLRVMPGEIHAVVGENGAGKSTLMKILYGIHHPDAGEIRIDGRPVHFASPADAIAAGIGMVHQHFMLVTTFTVADNVILGQEPGAYGLIDRAAARARIAQLAAANRLDVDPAAITGSLGVGQQQRVEILKVLYRNAGTLVLDEPTAVLTPGEVHAFFDTVRALRDGGCTVIVITHKLREVMELSDRVTVLRGGHNVAVLDTAATSAREIARLMVGREVMLPVLQEEIARLDAGEACAAAVDAAPAPHAVPLLEARDLCLGAPRRKHLLDGVSFELHAGEILGIAGVEGNGQLELTEVLAGLRRQSSGTVRLRGTDIGRLTPRRRFAAGLAVVTEDRQHKGLVLPLSLRENLLLGRRHERAFVRRVGGRGAEELLREFDVRPGDPRMRAAQLSGGNQQKLILAREFTRDAGVFIVSQPTRGIDMGSIEFVHRRLVDLRARGCAILLVSAELSEILALSDRVAVMYGGRLVFCAPNRNLAEEELGVYMTGGGATAGAAGGAA